MNSEWLDFFTGSLDEPLMRLMERIDKNGSGVLFLIDSDKKLTASISDGDIRKWIIKHGNLEASVGQIANYHPRYLFEDKRASANEFMEEQRITAVPILDSDYRINDVIIYYGERNVFKSRIEKPLENTPIVVMAGGKGTRLFPYTKILPKPLIPIGDVPIIERILNRFYDFGSTNFYMTVNYKKEMIKAYFSELSIPYRLKYIEESQPLGTAGGIRLIEDDFKEPIIVTNCDILVYADYSDMLKHHKEYGNDMTIVSAVKNLSIHYGVIHSREGGQVESMEEKPQISFFINTGMYIINPGMIELIPKNEPYNMTDLSNRALEIGKKVGMYPVGEGAFLDMGEFDEMRKMENALHDGNIGDKYVKYCKD